MTGPIPSGEVTLEEAVARIRALVDDLETHHDPVVVEAVFELLDWIDVLHREGLQRLAGGLSGVGYLEKALDDPIVAHLFAIYGLAPSQGSAAAVEAALEEVRPYVQSHGGEMTLRSIDEGVVHLQMHGACDGCPSAVVTLTDTVARAIRERWPGMIRVEVSEPPGPESNWTPVTIGRK